MTSKRFGILVLVAAVACGTALAGGGVWVSKDGNEHSIPHGAHAVLLTDDGNAFDLSDLRDGETRVFGTGERQVTVSRDGDIGRIEGDATPDHGAISTECDLNSDTCRIVTFDDNDRIAVVISKERECVNGVGDCDDVHVVGHGANVTTVREIVRCDDSGNCTEEVLHGGGAGHGEAFDVEVIVGPDGAAHEDVDVLIHSPHARIITKGGPGENVFVHKVGIGAAPDGADVFDTAKLLDGETRIFGTGDRAVVAVRDRDVVQLSRDASGDHPAMNVECRLPGDSCSILTFADDPEKVGVMIRKTRECAAGEDCDVPGEGGGHIRVLHVDGDDDGDDRARVRRIRFVEQGD